MRYGANGTFLYKTVTGAIGCGNGDWGDPLFGVVKTCAYSSSTGLPAPAPHRTGHRSAPAPAPSTAWVNCASEGGICAVPGTREVRYGANGTYAYKSVTGSIGCNNGVWGDPLFGVFKACAYAGDAAPAPHHAPAPAPRLHLHLHLPQPGSPALPKAAIARCRAPGKSATVRTAPMPTRR